MLLPMEHCCLHASNFSVFVASQQKTLEKDVNEDCMVENWRDASRPAPALTFTDASPEALLLVDDSLAPLQNEHVSGIAHVMDVPCGLLQVV